MIHFDNLCLFDKRKNKGRKLKLQEDTEVCKKLNGNIFVKFKFVFNLAC